MGADTKRVKPFFPQWLASQKIVLGHYLHVGYRSVQMMFYVSFSFSSQSLFIVC